MRIKTQPELIDSTAAAEFLGLASPGVLAVWRCTKRYDLPYIKVGAKILYDVEDLLAFLESRKVRQSAISA
jgi:Helix-turn-helix domain